MKPADRKCTWTQASGAVMLHIFYLWTKQGSPWVTRLIKCVAFWEMRYWAASIASRTAKTLFCGEEMSDLVWANVLMLHVVLRPKGWFTYRQICGGSFQEPHTLVQRALQKGNWRGEIKINDINPRKLRGEAQGVIIHRWNTKQARIKTTFLKQYSAFTGMLRNFVPKLNIHNAKQAIIHLFATNDGE